ncbi:hypothetical protein EVAR_62118_1 [Eumeta japonica]|uniref:Uncharacterized protein n=1 Tax=Eumeta variegata TaxID=151549 RepID=A0A4C1Z319_EUMVA|nr:hypothetical protein EVAR_62118_1 [Eumeta japonica]
MSIDRLRIQKKDNGCSDIDRGSVTDAERASRSLEQTSSTAPKVNRSCDGASADNGCRVTAPDIQRAKTNASPRPSVKSDGPSYGRSAYLKANKLVSNNSII